jgi:hypothetical protein
MTVRHFEKGIKNSRQFPKFSRLSKWNNGFVRKGDIPGVGISCSLMSILRSWSRETAFLPRRKSNSR